MHPPTETTQKIRPRHYHGNYVRWLFAFNSIVLLISFPLFKTETIMPIFFGTVLVIVLIILSALTTSELKWIHVVNIAVSLIGVATFEILAFATNASSDVLVFIVRQGIALSFLLTLYFSARSTLGMFSQTADVTPATPEESDSETKKENQELLEEIKMKNDSRLEP